MDILFDLISSADYENGETLKYYFVSDSSLTPEADIKKRTPSEIVNGIKNKTMGTLVTGTGVMNVNGARASAKPKHSEGFVEGDWITIVLEDRYGNLYKMYNEVGYVYVKP